VTQKSKKVPNLKKIVLKRIKALPMRLDLFVKLKYQ